MPDQVADTERDEVGHLRPSGDPAPSQELGFPDQVLGSVKDGSRAVRRSRRCPPGLIGVTKAVFTADQTSRPAISPQVLDVLD